MGTDAKHILAALKSGAISIEDAASEITKTRRSAQAPPKDPMGIAAPGDFQLKQSLGGYHKVIIERPGSINDIKIVDSRPQALGPHEVRIAVKAFSLNFADLLCTRGLYPNMPPYPFTPGLEVAGIVAGVGDAVQSFKPGDPVVAMSGTGMGGHATQVTCPSEQVFHKPESLSFEDACSLPVVAITMMVAFDKARLQWGERILIQTATGGTGLMAVQLAKYYGAEIYATAGSDHKLRYLENLDVPHRINYLETDFEAEIHRLTRGKGVDVVINTLPGDAIQKGLNCLSPEGRYIELAMTGIKSAKTIDLSKLTSNQTFYSIDPGRLKRKEVIRDHFNEVLRLTRHGILKATICKRFPLASVKEAYRYLENRKNIGKIVVTVPDALMYQEPPAPAPAASQTVRGLPIDVAVGGDKDARSVAIIGMSGKFAGARDLNQFWDNLAAGKNSIRDVQAWRWDADAPVDLGAGEGEDDGIYWKRGGFIEDIDKFDPLFFNISPAEAEYMDPQQRLFLEESWKTLEDAGLAPDTLSGRKCGVFVGVGKGDYLGARTASFQQVNANRLMGTAPAILAARISYLLNLTGPSIAVDTACSSSLVAIHQACQSIVGGECDMALAGGVCLLTTKELLVMAGKAGMLSPTGQCHTFDNNADGFVAGEGVGVLLLKSLARAIRDKDNIHAVIRGGGFNQDGRTNGITAPSAKSQMKLEKEVYERFAIDPGSISYVEAHGTGTKLGDPIEVSALSEVYRSYTDKRRYCAIGSVKTNIGHAMAAAGVASVIKVALALTRKQIPPSINFERENEHINFKDSPFFVNTELLDWTTEADLPRRAAVSSFGFSGTNVHMVLDEYEGEYEGETTDMGSDADPAVFVLSAKSWERLTAYAENMAAFLSQQTDSGRATLNLADIAYTSQVGREAMAHRLAVLATSMDELRDKLERFAAGEKNIDGVSWGQAKREAEAVRNRLDHNDASELIVLWTRGASVDWRTLYKTRTPKRVSLPVYPFERERYWMTDEPEMATGLQRPLQLHPLIHENTSDLNEQRFSTTFIGDEFFLADHLIGGKPMLPGAAFIEMARAAVVQAAAFPADKPVSIKNVAWVRPVTVEKERVEVHISLFPEASGDIAWEVWSLKDADAERVVHSRGTAGITGGEGAAAPRTESQSGLEEIQSRCTVHKNHNELYGTGVNGTAPTSFMCIDELFINNSGEEALAILELPSHLDETFADYGLHPSLLNGAFETCVFGLHPGIAKGETVLGLFERGEAVVPYALGEIKIVDSLLPKKCWAHALLTGDGDVKRFDIELFDESGNLILRLKRFAARSLTPSDANASRELGNPMIDRAVANDAETVFLKRFTGNEFFFTDHVVAGKRVLPGTAYLEMAQAAASHAAGINGSGAPDATADIVLENVVWTRPVVLDDGPKDVQLRFDRDRLGSTDKTGYEIFTTSAADGDASETLIHSSGSVFTGTLGKIPALDISEIKSQCSKHQVTADTCYEAFERMGLSYGPGHKGIETLYLGDRQVLARLALPDEVFETDGRFTLHPGLMDAALQAAIGLFIGPEASSPLDLKPAVPFALERLEVHGPCASTLWAHIKQRGTAGQALQKLDIDVCDDEGRICTRLRGFSTKTFSDPETGTLLLAPVWQEKAVPESAESQAYSRHMVFLCDEFQTQASAVKAVLPEVTCIPLTSKKKNIAGRFETYALQLFSEIKKILLEKSTDTQLIQLVIPGEDENFLLGGLSGLLKTAEMEHSTLFCQTILLPDTPEPITELLRENVGCPGDQVIRYQGDKRLVAGFESVGDNQVSDIPVPWKDNGVYLITGGAGGLGRIFAREIASRVTSPSIILTGRSVSGASVAELLTELETLGARAEYRKADVGKKAEVQKLISAVTKDYGGLNGIIHSAGMIRDNVITKKTRQDVKAVLAPKVAGLANLDEASRDLPLDLFILFSSAAGAMGNIGQADYACANGFMDAYARYRSHLVAAGKGSGQTLSVNWPLWQDGGMQVDDETLKLLNMNLGMIALETGPGIEALYRSLAVNRELNLPRTLVARGNIVKLRQKLLAPAVSVSDAAPSSAHTHGDGLTAEIIKSLMAVVSKMMKIRIEKIDPEEELGSYGFDSISLTELTNTINEQWSLELQPTLFFEYPTIAGYTAYLTDTHAAELASQFTGVAAAEKRREPNLSKVAPVSERKRPRFISQAAAQQAKTAGDVPMAVVGISGRFPMAEDVEAFWKNLEEGRHCITEIPEDRWDWKRFSGDVHEGETGVKWGGFIGGVGDFDPMFFGISPREAELMDPQQRLMMLYVWKAVEDAGIAPGVLSRTPTGVFISPGINEYMHLPGFPQSDPYAPMGLAISGIPNRISYALNLHGPSEYCETACSSALVALHRAIASMRMGECEQAIIGAVNLLLSPDGFSGVDAFGHLSPSGRPKSFQADADGYVRSEGVGAMLVKPLDKAVRDKDRIYAVIRGTGIAHGGRGMSLTAPTGRGMKAAMTQAFRNADIDPGTIAYIEAHGTATPMGDAVEINTLASGYAEISEQGIADPVQGRDADTPVYISSLKPCIGHGEIVSGMAALIKVIMALKHKTIPGVPGFGTLNGNISLDGSRFDINAENHPWELITDADGNPLPRRAAINSYGFGGVNAHAVIEEYIDNHAVETNDTESAPNVFVLSARSSERLKVYAGHLADFLTDTDVRLADVAYTLQMGREAMEHRLAVVADDTDALLEGLRIFGDPDAESGDFTNTAQVFTGGTEQETALPSADTQKALTERNLEKLAEYWANGIDVPWMSLYEDQGFIINARVSLPGYPFDTRRCWIEVPEDQTEETSEDVVRDNKSAGASVSPLPGERVREWLKRTLCRMLKLFEDEIGPDQPLGQMGFDSYSGMRLINRIKDAYGLNVAPERLLEYNTVDALSRYLAEKVDEAGLTCDDEAKRLDAGVSPVDEIDTDVISSDDITSDELIPDEVNLDELSESELDQLLKQHLSDE